MDGINKTLFDELENRLCSSKLENFLEFAADDYEKRQDTALKLASRILEPHKKDDIPEGILPKLAMLERNLKEIQPHQRDHVCHALLTFLLGSVIIDKCGLEEDSDFLFQWELASLLHDAGYLLEITDKINKNFLDDYEKNILDQEPNVSPSSGNRLFKYTSLYTKNSSQERNTLNLVNGRLREWGILMDAREIFDNMITGKRFDKGLKRTDHGVASAILVMKAIDKKYEKENPNQVSDQRDMWNFDNLGCQITNVCSAIFIHNLDSPNLRWDFKKTPLATLLKLCDELQGWGRASKNKPTGEPPTDYDIGFKNKQLVFYTRKEKDLSNKIKKVLNFPITIKEIR